MPSFKVSSVWNLGEAIHVIGVVKDGAIKGGTTLRDPENGEIVVNVESIAIGGGRDLPPDSVTLVVKSLPCSTEELTGRTLVTC
jgi:hypothetical protein